jgi:RimJ/RimL family protein N-acetyltransferase
MSAAGGARSAIVLRDGTPLAVRPIQPGDGDALVRFHQGLSAETTRLRYFSPHPTLSPDEVEHLTVVDHHVREALVVWAEGEIVAVARFEGLDDPATAEVAFVVSDRWQHRGIATALLEVLARRAREQGIGRFEADALVENRPMLDVFERSPFTSTRTTRGGVTHVALSLSSGDRAGAGQVGPPAPAVEVLAESRMAG